MRSLLSNKHFQHAIQVVLYAMIIIFLVRYISHAGVEHISLKGTNGLLLVVSVLFAIAQRFTFPWGWAVLLRDQGAQITNYQELNYIYAKSWLGRYIPGKVIWILGKIYYGNQVGISTRALSITSFLEIGAQMLLSALVGALSIFVYPDLYAISDEVKLGIGLLIVIILVFMFPPIFNRLLALTYRILRHEQVEVQQHVTNTTIRLAFSVFLVITLSSALPQFMLVRAFVPVGLDKFLYVIGAFSIATVMGTIALFAPSGLGVRESILVVALSAIMPADKAIVIAAAQRIWSLLVDLAFFGIARLLATIRNSNQKELTT